MTCGQIPQRMRTKSALLDWREDVVRLKRVRESAWSARARPVWNHCSKNRAQPSAEINHRCG
jgi:hypothetical protein